MVKRKNKSKDSSQMTQKVETKKTTPSEHQTNTRTPKEEIDTKEKKSTKYEIVRLKTEDDKTKNSLTIKESGEVLAKVKEQKYNKKAVMLLTVILAAIVLIIFSINALGLFIKRSSEYEIPLLYASEGKIKFINSRNKKPIQIGNYGQDADFDTIEHSNKNDKYILYSLESNLYLADTKSKKESEKIASGIETFQFSKGDKYIIYIDSNGNLYSYDKKNKFKLDSNVTLIVDVTKDKVFYKKDGNLYFKNLKNTREEKQKIATDYEDAVLSNDRSKILYSKALGDNIYEYHVYTLKNKKDEKILSDIYMLYDYTDNFTEFIYSVSNEPTVLDINNYINDDRKAEDENFKVYTFEDYWTGKVDYSTYKNSQKEAVAVEQRNAIRNAIHEDKNKSYNISTSLDVYYKKGDKNTKIADKVKKVVTTDMKNGRIIYTKEDYSSIEKIDMSSINSYQDIKMHIKNNLKSSIKYKSSDTDEIEITSGKKSVIAKIFKDEFYCEADGEIFYSKINKNKPVEIKLLTSNAEIVDWDDQYKKSLIVLTDKNNNKGSLKFIKSGKLEDIDTEVYEKNIKITYDKVYYFKNYKSNKGDYYEFSNKPRKIITDASKIYYIRDNYMYVLKDYSSKTYKYDLYRYKGRKLELLDYNVKDVYLK